MKLRNKKTGKTINGGFVVCEYKDGARFSVKDKPCFDSLDELKEEWEDYKPVDPLIKDEKIRKAVRAWAEANEFGDKMAYIYDADKFALSCWQASIEFNSHIGGLEDGKEYSFDELCGEEE